MQNSFWSRLKEKVTGFFRENKKDLPEYLLYLVLFVFILYIMPTFLLEPIQIKGSSMQDTLQNKDRVLIEKVSRYGDGPERFDIIVFTKQTGSQEKTYVKRIIGLPGDTVQIIENEIYLNGQVLPETYGKGVIGDAGLAAEPIELGDDEYFVLGDNRTVSVDSCEIGPVKKNEIRGNVIFRLFPWDSFGKVD